MHYKWWCGYCTVFADEWPEIRFIACDFECRQSSSNKSDIFCHWSAIGRAQATWSCSRSTRWKSCRPTLLNRLLEEWYGSLAKPWSEPLAHEIPRYFHKKERYSGFRSFMWQVYRYVLSAQSWLRSCLGAECSGIACAYVFSNHSIREYEQVAIPEGNSIRGRIVLHRSTQILLGIMKQTFLTLHLKSSDTLIAFSTVQLSWQSILTVYFHDICHFYSLYCLMMVWC